MRAEIDQLKELGYNVEAIVDGQRIYVIFKEFPFGEAYSPPRGDLLLYTSVMYPNAGFDMFWTEPQLKLLDGRMPQAADVVESYLGKAWRRFSWHLNRQWNPAHDSLKTWLASVEARLDRGT